MEEKCPRVICSLYKVCRHGDNCRGATRKEIIDMCFAEAEKTKESAKVILRFTKSDYFRVFSIAGLLLEKGVRASQKEQGYDQCFILGDDEVDKKEWRCLIHGSNQPAKKRT